jgi:hypothetical protein
MKITFTNTSSTAIVEVGRFVIPASSTLPIDFSAASLLPASAADIALLEQSLTLNQLSCVTDVLVPQGTGGTGAYVAGTVYSPAVPLLSTVLKGGVPATQLQAAFSATPTIDFSQGTNVVLAAVTANVTAITITNPPAVGTTVNFVIPTSGAYTITWPASFKKAADGVAAATKKGVASFLYDGINYNQIGGAIAFN